MRRTSEWGGVMCDLNVFSERTEICSVQVVPNKVVQYSLSQQLFSNERTYRWNVLSVQRNKIVQLAISFLLVLTIDFCRSYSVAALYSIISVKMVASHVSGKSTSVCETDSD